MELKTLEKLQDNISKVMIGNKGTMKLILTKGAWDAVFCDRDAESAGDTWYISAAGGADGSFSHADLYGRSEPEPGAFHDRPFFDRRAASCAREYL